MLMVGICLPCTALLAQAPALINYQGRVTAESGVAMEGMTTVALEFRLYDHATASGAANLVWGPFLYSSVTVVDGQFGVTLGQDSASPSRSIADVLNTGERFLSIRVNGGEELLPRQQILSAPYALSVPASGVTGQIQTGQIANSAVTNAKIANNAVNTAKIANNSITRQKIADGEVRREKLAPLSVESGRFVRSSSITWSTTTRESWLTVSNLQVNISTVGRPVLINLYSTSNGAFIAWNHAWRQGRFRVRIQRVTGSNATTIFDTQFGSKNLWDQGAVGNARTWFPVGQTVIDNPSAGSHTYRVQVRLLNREHDGQQITRQLDVNNVRISALEL